MTTPAEIDKLQKEVEILVREIQEHEDRIKFLIKEKAERKRALLNTRLKLESAHG